MPRGAWADAVDGPVRPWGGSWPKLRNLGVQNVKFEPSVISHEVIAYSVIYGQHPKEFVFVNDGQKIQHA